MKDTTSGGVLFPDELGAGALNDKEIISLVKNGLLIGQNYEETGLEASSYDLRVGFKGIIGGEGSVKELNENQLLEIQPGQYAGIISLEKINLPKYIFARLGAKRALSYEGLILLSGSIVDPGYQGHLLFGIYNASQRKVVLYPRKKIANIIFEKLSTIPDRQVSPDPFLINGNFPESFIEKMVNAEALGWMQLSDKVKEIEKLKGEILEIKRQYNDVMSPLKELTINVSKISETVKTLSGQAEDINKDIEDINVIVRKNNDQIATLTTSLGVMTSEVGNVKSKVTQVDTTVTELKTDVGRYKIIWYIFWAIFLLAAGYFLNKLA